MKGNEQHRIYWGKYTNFTIEKWFQSGAACTLNAGVNTSYIGQIERGEKNPTIKTLEKISKALGIALIDLLFLVDSRGGGSKAFCSQSSAVLTPEQIKQCLLEVLIDNTNMIVDKQKY